MKKYQHIDNDIQFFLNSYPKNTIFLAQPKFDGENTQAYLKEDGALVITSRNHILQPRCGARKVLTEDNLSQIKEFLITQPAGARLIGEYLCFGRTRYKSQVAVVWHEVVIDDDPNEIGRNSYMVFSGYKDLLCAPDMPLAYNDILDFINDKETEVTQRMRVLMDYNVMEKHNGEGLVIKSINNRDKYYRFHHCKLLSNKFNGAKSTRHNKTAYAVAVDYVELFLTDFSVTHYIEKNMSRVSSESINVRGDVIKLVMQEMLLDNLASFCIRRKVDTMPIKKLNAAIAQQVVAEMKQQAINAS